VELTVEYDFIPGEPAVRYYTDGSGYPGTPDEIRITKIWDDMGKNITSTIDFSSIEDLVFAEHRY
jgi:hypothetical protein